MSTLTEKREQTAKALKMKGGLRKLGDEYAESNAPVSLLLDAIASLPMEDLATLFDLIATHELPSEAAAALAMSEAA